MITEDAIVFAYEAIWNQITRNFSGEDAEWMYGHLNTLERAIREKEEIIRKQKEKLDAVYDALKGEY